MYIVYIKNQPDSAQCSVFLLPTAAGYSCAAKRSVVRTKMHGAVCSADCWHRQATKHWAVEHHTSGISTDYRLFC
jgi:hypothetical protein